MLEEYKFRLENYLLLPHTGIAIYSFLLVQVIFAFIIPIIDYHS